MCEKMALEGAGDCALQLLDALVVFYASATVHLRKRCHIDFGLDRGIRIVSLTTADAAVSKGTQSSGWVSPWKSNPSR